MAQITATYRFTRSMTGVGRMAMPVSKSIVDLFRVEVKGK